jgi:hypothetical protein
MEGIQPDVSFDDFVVAVNDIQRRELLIGLLNAAPEDEFDPFAVDPAMDARRRAPDLDTLPTSLYHVHLPTLETLGFIFWDRDAGTIRRGPDFDAIEPFLTVLVEYQTALPTDFLHYDPINA